MTPKNKVTVSSRPTNPRPSSAERRAAQIANDATKQATLKDEAAARRRAREQHEGDSAGPAPRRGGKA